jgi:heat shock protein HslJ
MATMAIPQGGTLQARLYFKSLLICLGVVCSLAVVSAQTIALDHNPGHGAQPADIEGRDWHISNYFVNKSQTWPYRGLGQKVEAYLTFESGVIKGTPGCGWFTGKYQRTDEQLNISAKWTDDLKTPCGDEAVNNAKAILEALANVRQIHTEPPYWRSDALLLNDGNGSTQVTLSPMQPGNDLSELQDSFWHLIQLENADGDLSDVVINIETVGMTFSTPSYFISFPYQYKMSGLEFHPAYAYGNFSPKGKTSRDKQIAKTFEKALHRVEGYKLSQGNLALFGSDQHRVMVLKYIQSTGLENRKWRIAKYRSEGIYPRDSEGLTDATEDADIVFLNGQVRGSPGCGGWTGTYQLSGNKLRTQAGAFLAGLCSKNGDIQGQMVVKDFNTDLTIEQTGDHVLLRDNSGRARILLVPY